MNDQLIGYVNLIRKIDFSNYITLLHYIIPNIFTIF